MLTVGVDAGGTATKVAMVSPGGKRSAILPSVNPASVGDASADENMRKMVEVLLEEGGSTDLQGWMGSAAVEPHTVDRERRRILECLSKRGLSGRLVLSNDALLPLLAPPLNGVGRVIIVGTGSVVLGRNGAGRLERAGGYEYLLSDRGGAFDLGLHGLRAAAQAEDGWGPPTALTEAAWRVYGRDARACGRLLACAPFPKWEVARFARAVCEASQQGDEVATAIVDAAATDLAALARAVKARLGPTCGEAIVICGGLAYHHESYREKIVLHLEERGTAAAHCEVIPSAADRALALATALDDSPWLCSTELPLELVELSGA